MCDLQSTKFCANVATFRLRVLSESSLHEGVACIADKYFISGRDFNKIINKFYAAERCELANINFYDYCRARSLILPGLLIIHSVVTRHTYKPQLNRKRFLHTKLILIKISSLNCEKRREKARG